MTLKEYRVLHFDGASKTKSSGVGLVLQSPEGFMIEYALKLEFPTMNNETEYEILIVGLGLARVVRAKNHKICGDLRLVVAQVNGEFEAKDDIMAKYLRVIKGILTQIDEWYTEHVSREEKTTADALSNFASSKIKNYPRSTYFQVLKNFTIHVINLIASIGVASCWINPIKTHHKTRWLPHDAQEARNLSVRALRYSLIDSLMYKRSVIISYLNCLRTLKAEEALKEAREGICGQNLEGRALAHKITRLGFYWPVMLADAEIYVKKCDRCQRHAPIANGQAEVANRIFFDGLKKKVERSRNTWMDELLPILWAYHTACKVTTKAIPFMLAYEGEAVVPLKITHQSPRVEIYEPETNEEGMRLTLDLVDDVRDEANTRNVENQWRASLYYNRRVKERFFQ
ncbi:uncharacterized protein LOC141693464 [Apium graveolens]|uniref:uncharacterized protein LOC141693464 n=1 Tax=Apium graveolens TaxID=4045 RepID=UPI003D79D298